MKFIWMLFLTVCSIFSAEPLLAATVTKNGTDPYINYQWTGLRDSLHTCRKIDAFICKWGAASKNKPRS